MAIHSTAKCIAWFHCKLLLCEGDLDCFAGVRTWTDQVREELEKQGRGADRLDRVKLLLDMADDLPVDLSHMTRDLHEVAWLCRAEQSQTDKVAMADLNELCAAEWAQGTELRQALQDRHKRASEWCQRAKQAMSERKTVDEFRELLNECAHMDVETEEECLLEFHVENSEAWRTKLMETYKAEFIFLKGLENMFQQAERIALDLPEMHDLKKRIQEREKMLNEKKVHAKEKQGHGDEEEEEEDKENWACCDGCSKWRRLGAEALPEGKSFFCVQVGLSCCDPVRNMPCPLPCPCSSDMSILLRIYSVQKRKKIRVLDRLLTEIVT